MTYIIPSSDPVTIHGYPVGIITEAPTGRLVATYKGGWRFVLDTPLCSGCDCALENGGCLDCDTSLAPVQQYRTDDGRIGWAA